MDNDPEETDGVATETETGVNDTENQSTDDAADYLRALDERAENQSEDTQDVDIEGLRRENDRLQRQLKAVSDAYVEIRRGTVSKTPERTATDQPVDVDEIIKATRPTYSRTF